MAAQKASGHKGEHPAKERLHPKAHAEIELGFGSLFKGLGDFVGVLGKLVEAGEERAERTGEFKVKGLGEKAQGIYGVFMHR